MNWTALARITLLIWGISLTAIVINEPGLQWIEALLAGAMIATYVLWSEAAAKT